MVVHQVWYHVELPLLPLTQHVFSPLCFLCIPLAVPCGPLQYLIEPLNESTRRTVEPNNAILKVETAFIRNDSPAIKFQPTRKRHRALHYTLLQPPLMCCLLLQCVPLQPMKQIQY